MTETSVCQDRLFLIPKGRNMITVKIPASIEQIAKLQEKIAEALPEEYKSLQFKAELITEEILTNICKYAYNGEQGESTFACGMATIDNNEAFLIEISDSGVEYNPFTNLDPNTLGTTIETRKIGGVGLHLVQQMATHYVYIRIDNRNKLQIFLVPNKE